MPAKILGFASLFCLTTDGADIVVIATDAAVRELLGKTIVAMTCYARHFLKGQASQ
jgi:hypothetical protein